VNGPGERGSLPLALLLTIVIGGLSVALAPVVLVQVRESRSTSNWAHALHAAETGLDVAVAAIRAARDSSGQGLRALLPCGPISGTAGIEAGATYQTRLEYFIVDPSDVGSTPVTCADARDLSEPMPRWARLTATGATSGGATVRRALRGDYPLQAGPAPAPTPTWGPDGDPDYVHPRQLYAWSAPETTAYCIDPGYSQPPAGTIPTLQLCQAENFASISYKQNWYYRQDLTVATVGSILNDTPMCLDAGSNPAAGNLLTMQTCQTPAPARQRWYLNNFYNLELAKSTGAGPDDWALSGLCVNVDRPGDTGSRFVLGGGGNCHSSSYNDRQTFGMDPKVGPGQAGSRRLDCTASAGYPCLQIQLMNHAEPSRCLDKLDSYLATMECAQDPDPTKIRWNQQWRLPAAADGPTGTVGPLVTVDPTGVKRCLTASSDVATQVVCDPTNPATNQKFTVYRNTGNEYTMYRIRDSSGRCMTYPNGDDFSSGEDAYLVYWKAIWNWKLHLDSCVNSAADPRIADHYGYASIVRRQKWDAPAVLPNSYPAPAPTPAVAQSPIPADPFPLVNYTEVPPSP
jgi:hypothetical protein